MLEDMHKKKVRCYSLCVRNKVLWVEMHLDSISSFFCGFILYYNSEGLGG